VHELGWNGSQETPFVGRHEYGDPGGQLAAHVHDDDGGRLTARRAARAAVAGASRYADRSRLAGVASLAAERKADRALQGAAVGAHLQGRA